MILMYHKVELDIIYPHTKWSRNISAVVVYLLAGWKQMACMYALIVYHFYGIFTYNWTCVTSIMDVVACTRLACFLERHFILSLTLYIYTGCFNGVVDCPAWYFSIGYQCIYPIYSRTQEFGFDTAIIKLKYTWCPYISLYIMQFFFTTFIWKTWCETRHTIRITIYWVIVCPV